jgi:hypothetical protein
MGGGDDNAAAESIPPPSGPVTMAEEVCEGAAAKSAKSAAVVSGAAMAKLPQSSAIVGYFRGGLSVALARTHSYRFAFNSSKQKVCQHNNADRKMWSVLDKP